METVNKDSYNAELLHRLKIQLSVWLPAAPFPLLLWPTFATRTTYVENYFVRHTHYEKWCACSVEKGHLQVVSGGKVCMIRTGETALIPPGPHAFSARKKDVVLRTLGIEGSLLRLILETLSLGQCLVVKNFLTEEYIRLFDEVCFLLDRKDLANGGRLSLLAYAILMYAADFVTRNEVPDELMRCRQFIQRNLFQKITLKDLCDETLSSRSHLCAMFKKHLAISPGEYIARERRKFAMDLLRSSPDLSVKQVAGHCGYRSQLYFASDFKKHTGLTPTQYRNSMTRRDSATPPG